MTIALPNELLDIIYEYAQGCKICLDVYGTIKKKLTKEKSNLINSESDWLLYNCDTDMNIKIQYYITKNINHGFLDNLYRDLFDAPHNMHINVDGNIGIDDPISKITNDDNPIGLFNDDYINRSSLYSSFACDGLCSIKTITIPIHILSQFIAHGTALNCAKLYHSYNVIKEDIGIIILFYNTLFNNQKNKNLINCPPSVLSLSDLSIKELYEYNNTKLISDYRIPIITFGQETFYVCIDVVFDESEHNSENVIVYIDNTDICYSRNKLSNNLSKFKSMVFALNIMSLFDDIHTH